VKTPTNFEALDGELKNTLIRHLPLGLEGVGVAQAAAVTALLNRRCGPVLGDAAMSHIQGARMLGEQARLHRDSVKRNRAGKQVCHRCGGAPKPVLWPCPIWEAACLLDAVDPRACD
jgi:hypothetical protein